MLGAADRDRRALLALDRERAHALGRPHAAQRAVAEGVGVAERRAHHRAARADARRGAARAERVVADVDPHRLLAALLQRQPAGERARHPVVAHRGHQRDAGALGGRAVLLEDAADERRLAGRVEVGGAAGDRGAHGRLAALHERPDGRDEDVALADEREHGVGAHDVAVGGLQAAQVGRPAPPGARGPARQHGALTGAREALGDQPARVAGGSEDDDTTGHRAERIRPTTMSAAIPKRQEMQRDPRTEARA